MSAPMPVRQHTLRGGWLAHGPDAAASRCPVAVSRPGSRRVSKAYASSVKTNQLEADASARRSSLLQDMMDRARGPLPLFPAWAPGSQQGAEEVLQEANRQEEEVQQRSAPADITPYLEHVSLSEMRNIRRLSNLCSLSYKPHLVTARGMWLRHRLELVTTSWTYKARSDGPRTAADAVAQGDGMAVGFEDATATYASMESIDDDPQLLAEPPADGITTPATGLMLSADVSASPLAAILQPATVASKLAEAAAAASAAAAAAAALASSTVGKLAGSRDGGMPSSTSGSGSNAVSSNSNSKGSGSTLRGAGSAGSSTSDWSGGGPYGQYSLASGDELQAAFALDAHSSTDGHSPAKSEIAAYSLSHACNPSSSDSAGPVSNKDVATLAATTPTLARASNLSTSAASAASAIPSNPAAPTGQVASAAAAAAAAAVLCPSEWFVCDDPSSHLRIFVIQGSDSVDHWRLNLTFDPVPFEDPSTGVMVHRGCYQAALELYDKFLPLTYDHLDSSPFAQIAFTGHSIGGSLAMLLTLLYKKRGVLQANSIVPCYQFGAPAIVCGAKRARQSWDASGFHQDLSSIDPAASCLLPSLGLDTVVVRNVMMHRDIVPRAFTCNYPEIISRILKGWGPAFRLHSGLDGDGHKHLYSFVGSLYVLQPDRGHAFVLHDSDHPLLPPGPGLYRLRAPRQALSTRHSNGSGSLSGSYDGRSDGTASALAASDGPPSATQHSSSFPWRSGSNPALASAKQQPKAKVPACTGEAVLAIMDNPHPLQTLTDPHVYKDGMIVRYHHPDNLTQALGRLCYITGRREKISDPAGQ